MASSQMMAGNPVQTRRTRRLRVAHVTATYPPYWSGISNVAYYNARELAMRGHEVHVFTAQWPAGDCEDVPGVTVHRLWTPLRMGNAPFTPALLTALARFDVVHLHWPFIFGAELCWLGLQFRKTPYVMTYHLDLRADRRQVFGIYQRFFGHRLARGAQKIIAVSNAHLRSSQIFPAIADRPDDIVEVPNGVNTSAFHPAVSGSPVRQRLGIPPDVSLILFVGALDSAHEYKGVPDLIAAFGSLAASDAWLLLVGDGDLAPAYRALAAQLPAAARERIVFAGAVPHQRLPPFYAAADLCVLPSRQPESFGMVLIEAMACGRPVIATTSPGVCSVVEKGVTGLLVPPGDCAALAAAIRALLADSVQRQAMGQRGRSVVEMRYSWERVGTALEQVYESIL